MMKMRNKESGLVLNIREFFMTKVNFWEYFVTDEEPKGNDIQFCLVRGFEQELGDVSIEEMLPYIMTHVFVTSKNYHEIIPAIGYEWIKE